MYPPTNYDPYSSSSSSSSGNGALYPSLQPLATADQAPTAPLPQQQPLHQQPHQQPLHYPSVQTLAAEQQLQQQPPYPGYAAATTAGLADDMQRLTVQQQQPAAASPYPQLHPQQPQYAQPYPQVQQPLPAPYPQHSGSGNSHHYDASYGSGNSHHYSNQPQQQQPGVYGGSSFGASQHSHSINSSGSYSYSGGPAAAADSVTSYQSPYPASTAPCYGGGGLFGSQQVQQQPYQQQAEPLPPYPQVPKALPVMSYTVAPEKVSHGYDVMLYIQHAKNLPAMDWWNGLADPYVIVTAHVANREFQYKTATKRGTVNPDWENEFFQMGNLPTGTTFFVEVWDKDVVTDDDVIGRASWSFCPGEMLPASTPGGGLLCEDNSWGRLLVELPLKHPGKAKKAAGEIGLEVCYRPSTHVAPPRMLGPVRFRQHLSPTAGVFTGHWWSNEDTMCFSTFKLFLTNISGVFDGVKMPWNRKYDKAVAIFKNPVVLSGLRTQHSALYSTHIGNNRGGVLSSAADFFELFKNGMRDGQRRFFTYVLCEDSLRCSETGAPFFADIFSKHAMHSGAAEEVLFAGEFCIMPCPGAAGGHKLVVDNNSGTYAPAKAKLPLMQQLFTQNFRDMTVEVLDMKDPRLAEYQLACPSRSGLSGAAAAAAAAATPATSAGGGRRSRDGSSSLGGHS